MSEKHISDALED